MKKLAIVLVFVTVLASFTACSSRTPSIEEAKFLTFTEGGSTTEKIITNEGVSFTCSKHYVLADNVISGDIPAAGFMLEQGYLDKNYENGKIEGDFEIFSNSDMFGIQYLDYEGNIIATEKVQAKTIKIPEEYAGVYVDQVVIFVDVNKESYKMLFCRTGA